jgi:hypothetical protein
MGSREALEEGQIVVGKPLPFSIFTADGKLLLAQGRMVESDRLRDMLLRNGRYCETEGADTRSVRAQAAPEEEPAGESPLDKLQRQHDPRADAHHYTLSIARNETDKAFGVQILGVQGRCIIVTAPVHPDGSLAAILAGQMWLCRTFQLQSAFRFMAVASKVAFEPFPHVYLQLKKEVEHRRVRGAPRAKVAVRAQLHTPDPVPCLISNLSTSGACIALEASTTLAKGQQVRLSATLGLLQSKFGLTLDAAVMNVFGASDSRNPEVAFYGVQFSEPTEKDSLLLHAFVHEHLLSEINRLGHLLMPAAGYAALGEELALPERRKARVNPT